MTYTYEQILNIATAASGATLALAILTLLSTQWTICSFVGLCLVCILSIGTGVASQFLRQLKPCDSHSWASFFKVALQKIIAVTLARYAVWNMKRTYRSRSAMRAKQEATLMGLIKESRDTVFGRDHKFSEIQGIDDYRALVPVRDYADLDKYNQLAYKGEPNVFFTGSVEYLCKTSGTTGKNKTFPGAKRFMSKMMQLFITSIYCLQKFVQNSGRKPGMSRQVVVSVHPVDRKNEFGIPVGPVSKFFGSQGDLHSTPEQVFLKVHDARTAFYIHAVFALWYERIGEVNAFFPTSLITFMRCISTNWDSVLKDIENGRLSADKVDVDADLLNILNARLSPKPDRAAQLRVLFGDGQDLSGFFEKAWPEVPCVILARSGSFQSSYRYLRKYLGNVPTFGPMMGGTEGFVGINLNTTEIDFDSPEIFHPLLNPSFVEFVPVDANGNDLGDAKLAHELKVGCLYETVLTSHNCFRLRSGDVIKVIKMDDCAPVFELSHRKSHVLSVHVEKTTEKSLQASVMLTAERLGSQVVDFTAADCYLYEPVAGVSLGTKYYAMFVELDGDRRLTDDEKLMFDKALREVSENYDLFRGDGHINGMQVIQVGTGAFAALRQDMMKVNKDISEVQFKMPRVLRGDGQVKCLLDRQL